MVKTWGPGLSGSSLLLLTTKFQCNRSNLAPLSARERAEGWQQMEPGLVGGVVTIKLLTAFLPAAVAWRHWWQAKNAGSTAESNHNPWCGCSHVYDDLKEQGGHQQAVFNLLKAISLERKERSNIPST